ncbi:MAG: hypothetical protein DRR15_01660 [Gammaproteobacteria bacterium]|nr:MAG: hypothetical protein DRR15_01660 [Gammaproteobacteria bacterium]
MKNETSAAVTQLFEDENCTKHRNGGWIGPVGVGKPFTSIKKERNFDVSADVPIVVQMFWYDGYGSECGQAFAVTPKPDYEYKFVFFYAGGLCELAGYSREFATDEFVIMSEPEAKPVRVCAP